MPEQIQQWAPTKATGIEWRGATVELYVGDDPDHPGHIRVLLTCDPPPAGLHREVYQVSMRAVEGA